MDYKINYKVKHLNSILCEIDKVYQSLLMNKNVSDSEYAVLFAMLELGEGCMQKDIADNSFISKKTINSTIKKFEREELITLKAGKYPNMHIYLTKKGHEYIQKNIIPIIELENKFMEAIPDDEFEKLFVNCSKYIKHFRTQVEEYCKN